MAQTTTNKRSAAMRILFQTRMLRARRLWGGIRHKTTPDLIVLTNNRVVQHLKTLEFAPVPNQLFTYCGQNWLPSSAAAPVW